MIVKEVAEGREMGRWWGTSHSVHPPHGGHVPPSSPKPTPAGSALIGCAGLCQTPSHGVHVHGVYTLIKATVLLLGCCLEQWPSIRIFSTAPVSKWLPLMMGRQIYIVYLRRKNACKWVIASSEYDQRDV